MTIVLFLLSTQALQKCDRFIEALDTLQKAYALAPEDKTVAAEMEQLQAHISHHVLPMGVGCCFSWGLASTGALGHPEGRDRTVPTSLAAMARKHVVDVACGAMHTGEFAVNCDTYLEGVIAVLRARCSIIHLSM